MRKQFERVYEDSKMEARIASQLKERKPADVSELYLDNVQSSSISGLNEEYTGLQKLSIVNCGLTNLDGLPSLSSLEKLLLSDNRLTGNLDNLSRCNSLKKVALAGNKIANIEELKPLSKLPDLVSLDLYNCPVTAIDNYRNQVFELLPSLNSLDGLDKSGEEVDDSEGEEEEEECDSGEGSDESDEEPGLDYLLNDDLGSESSGSEKEYDPDADDPPPADDFIVPSDDEEEREDGAGPSRPKKPKLDPSAEEPEDSDSD